MGFAAQVGWGYVPDVQGPALTKGQNQNQKVKDRSRKVQKDSLLKETSRVEVMENKLIVKQIPIVSIGKKKRENHLKRKLTKRENLVMEKLDMAFCNNSSLST